jgi:hypothetical protein
MKIRQSVSLFLPGDVYVREVLVDMGRKDPPAWRGLLEKTWQLFPRFEFAHENRVLKCWIRPVGPSVRVVVGTLDAYQALGDIWLPEFTRIRQDLDAPLDLWLGPWKRHLFVYLSASGGDFFADPIYMETVALTDARVDIPGSMVSDMETLAALHCMCLSAESPDFREGYDMSGWRRPVKHDVVLPPELESLTVRHSNELLGGSFHQAVA